MKGRTETRPERPMRKDRDLYLEGIAEGLRLASRQLEIESERDFHSRRTSEALKDMALSMRARIQDLHVNRDLSLCWWQTGDR